MRWMWIALLAFAGALRADDAAYEPLRLYAGAWKVTPKGAKSDELVNVCALTGQFFTCQQTVNGKVGALIVFVPGEKRGHYYNNAIMPDGFAGGRGELTIEGSRWVYSSKSEDGKRRRTVNLFTGRDRIHFEIAESSDGEHWTVLNSGDETRVK